MRGHTHALIGFASVTALNLIYPVTGNVNIAASLLLGALGGLLPDLDSDESEIRQMTRTNRNAGCIGKLVSIVMPSHRGLTHEPIVALVLIALALPFGVWPLALAVGYASHLIADGMTKQGLPLFGRWRVYLMPRPLRITTGSFFEFVVAVAVGVWLWLVGLPALTVDWSLVAWLVEWVREMIGMFVSLSPLELKY